MRVVITSTGTTLESDVDPRFGRARNFMLVDTESGEHRAVANEGAVAGHGAGIATAKQVVDLGAEYVLTGHCGPNAFRTLEAAGLKVVVGVAGTVAEAIERLKRGELSPTEGADVEGHWS